MNNKLGFIFLALLVVANAANEPFEVELFGDFHQFYMYYAVIGVGLPSKLFTVVVLARLNDADAF